MSHRARPDFAFLKTSQVVLDYTLSSNYLSIGIVNDFKDFKLSNQLNDEVMQTRGYYTVVVEATVDQMFCFGQNKFKIVIKYPCCDNK